MCERVFVFIVSPVSQRKTNIIIIRASGPIDRFASALGISQFNELFISYPLFVFAILNNRVPHPEMVVFVEFNF